MPPPSRGGRPKKKRQLQREQRRKERVRGRSASAPAPAPIPLSDEMLAQLAEDGNGDGVNTFVAADGSAPRAEAGDAASDGSGGAGSDCEHDKVNSNKAYVMDGKEKKKTKKMDTPFSMGLLHAYSVSLS
jgi:hypothetical protein